MLLVKSKILIGNNSITIHHIAALELSLLTHNVLTTCTPRGPIFPDYHIRGHSRVTLLIIQILVTSKTKAAPNWASLLIFKLGYRGKLCTKHWKLLFQSKYIKTHPVLKGTSTLTKSSLQITRNNFKNQICLKF